MERVKEFFRPRGRKFGVLGLLLTLAAVLGACQYVLGINVPGGLRVLRFLGLPLRAGSQQGMSNNILLLLLFFLLMLIWLYLLSCVLITVFRGLKAVRWDAKKLGIVAGVVVVVIVICLLVRLGHSGVFAPSANDEGATSSGVAAVVGANNRFALDLYAELDKEDDGNLFFSPWSISTAMAMAYEGAKGQTADEIRDVFPFPQDDLLRRSSFARLLNTINKGSGEYKLHTANALWLQEGYPFLDSYKETVEGYYLGRIEDADFVGKPGKAADDINGWVSRKTAGKIKDIVSPDMFTNLTRAVLANAIYFKGEWVEPFDKDDTRPEDFTLDSGAVKKVPTMRLTDNDLRFKYAEDEQVQVLQLPYKGDKISMLIILPKSDIASVESIVSVEKLDAWRSQLTSQTVYIYLPKFRFETSYSLSDHLQRMGVETPFAWPGADFTAMSPTGEIYIDKVLHKAYIDVYEKGTEAAAATIVMMAGAAMPQFVEFRADHPFLFIIQETGSGNILFLGRVMDPAA